MSDLRPLVLALMVLLAWSFLGACQDEDQDEVLSGSCELGTTHCVDQETIQYCQAGQWAEPEGCPPDLAGEGPFQVEIITYCGDGACRPAG